MHFKTNTFFCFSPLAMVLTIIIELVLLVHLLVKFNWSKTVLLASGLLLFLALFQIAEYGICEKLGFTDTVWARFGFASITMLPIIGLHLVYSIADKTNRGLLFAGYVASFAWISAFVLGGVMHGAVCSGNYVLFDMSEPWEGYYYLFYNFVILLAFVQAVRFSRETKKINIKKALHWLMIGYLSFTVPAAIIWFVTDGADTALPSIMCGFAVILATIIGLRVVPTATSKKY